MRNNQDDVLASPPTSEELENEPAKAKRKGHLFRNALIAVFLTAVVTASLTFFLFPVMRIRGSSMSPNLNNGSFVVAYRTETVERGEVCCFYSGNAIMCKRVIALGGEVIDIDEDGIVYVNGELLDEPYILAADLGMCDIEFPYKVPWNSYFVMGDNRAVSRDSRYSYLGSVDSSQVVGKLLFCIWPPEHLGGIE